MVYWLLPDRLQKYFLLVASYTFYWSWSPLLLVPLVGLTVVDYTSCQIMEYEKTRWRRRFLLGLSVVSGLGFLGFFKYYNFFITSLETLLGSFGLTTGLGTLNLILPIGISFYTFQKLGYAIDVYKGRIPAEKNLVTFAVFVAYFPQLIAGPIERAKDLLPKINGKKFFQKIPFSKALYLVVFGLFSKVVLADSLAPLVDSIFSLAEPTGSQVVMGTYAFAFQIYGDFLGYSMMARGLSLLLGIQLSTNFKIPYFSWNPRQFWRRWHITLSFWIRDYLYIPLGGSRTAFLGVIPLLVTFVLMGLWHGAAWNFVLWGFFWFVVIMLYRICTKKKREIGWFAKVLLTILFFHITCFGWLIFRAQSFEQIVSMSSVVVSGVNFLELLSFEYFSFFLVAGFFIIYELLQLLLKDQLFVHKKGFYFQALFYFILFFVYLELGAASDVTFLYFQF